MEIVSIIIAVIFVFMFLSRFSKSIALENLSNVASGAGELMTYTGHQIRANLIESQINKINLGSNFMIRYQEQGKVIFMYATVDSNYKYSEMTEVLKEKVINEANSVDFNLIESIEKSELLYKKCKELEVEVLNVSGSTIGYSDRAGEYIKKGKVLKVYKVGKYELIDKKLFPKGQDEN
ncbi:hypothetical protein [Hwangdonia lutea]|uniref:Uncharacterized protein n=1 Tax=Hwangdonia lutea TaxID=3075823 RepID=A0AA97ER23_9FLAO|nr:hypothetical protein [Hwangdonia sp. SCSIO 19198]WOD44930.1 hypothetical protein RNZ46_06580 [Hwangdonia sp. SCSIO 19198]